MYLLTFGKRVCRNHLMTHLVKKKNINQQRKVRVSLRMMMTMMVVKMKVVEVQQISVIQINFFQICYINVLLVINLYSY